jgi:hypothetical protein
LAATEKAQGHKLSVSEDGSGSFSSFVQTNSDMNVVSDPICSSAGCTQYKHPSKERGYKIDYPVPQFGADADVIATKKHTDMAEGILGHSWNPVKVTEEDEYEGNDTWGSFSGSGKFIVPQPYKDFTLTDHDHDYEEIIHGRPNYDRT